MLAACVAVGGLLDWHGFSFGVRNSRYFKQGPPLSLCHFNYYLITIFAQEGALFLASLGSISLVCSTARTITVAPLPSSRVLGLHRPWAAKAQTTLIFHSPAPCSMAMDSNGLLSGVRAAAMPHLRWLPNCKAVVHASLVLVLASAAAAPVHADGLVDTRTTQLQGHPGYDASTRFIAVTSNLQLPNAMVALSR